MSMKSLAEEHGGKRSARFSQIIGLKQNWRKLIPDSQGGVCGGLSIMWLSAQKAGLTAKVFGQKYSAAVFKYAEHAQQLGANNRMGGQQGIDAVATYFSLNTASIQVNVNNGNIAKWIVTGPAPLVFIALHRHAIAANVRKPIVRFFDPEYGQFRFPDTLKFVLFLADYLVYTNQTARFLKFYG